MKKRLIIIIPIILLIISVFFLFHDSEYYESTVDLDNTLAELIDEEDIDIINDLKESYNNEDIVGLLEIPNTSYKAIVTQNGDNSFYLNHDAYGNKNKIGNPFLDYRVDINEDKKILIYGHNSRFTEMPFKILESYYDKDYFSNHKYLKITTDKRELTYEIFSVFIETSDWSYMKTDFKNTEEWNEHLKELKEKSMYDTGVAIDDNDDILILQTCSTKKEFRKYKKKFLLVISRRVN